MFVAPPGYQPIYNPAIPYLGPIAGGLRDGMSVYVQGSIPHHITRFFVNLLCGETEGSDIAMHINPRFDVWDKVVFNSCQNGYWHSEEKIHRMPFSKGSMFEMVIMAFSHGYQIKINGSDFHTFKHRLPFGSARGLHIAGDVSIQTINIIGGGMGGMGGMGGIGGMGVGYPGGNMAVGYPGDMGGGMGGGYPGGGMNVGYPGGMGGVMGEGYPVGGMGVGYPGGMGVDMGGDYPGSDLPIMCGQPDFHPTLPYSIPIPRGMFRRRTVIIRGMVPYGGCGMAIRFVVSRTQDIALHLNSRVREGVLVRNSMFGGNWGNEEMEMTMNPFIEGQYFELSIRCGHHKFKVFVNGQHLFDYSHRFHSFHEIDRLDIEGDVQLSYVHL